MADNEINEMISVLEKIRAEKYPEIPAKLIQDIVKAEFLNQYDRTKAANETQKIIDDFLKNVTV